MKIKLKWNKTTDDIAEEKTGGKDGLLFLASEMKRLMDPYVPAQNMMLTQNVRTYVEGDNGIVHYQSPYAHYQYEGKLYVDPKTDKGAFYSDERGFWSRPGAMKVPTNRSLEHSKFRHPLATSHWDQAMKVARMDDLTQAYKNYIGGK